MKKRKSKSKKRNKYKRKRNYNEMINSYPEDVKEEKPFKFFKSLKTESVIEYNILENNNNILKIQHTNIYEYFNINIDENLEGINILPTINEIEKTKNHRSKNKFLYPKVLNKEIIESNFC
jgi:hypothetical protein